MWSRHVYILLSLYRMDAIHYNLYFTHSWILCADAEPGKEMFNRVMRMIMYLTAKFQLQFFLLHSFNHQNPKQHPIPVRTGPKPPVSVHSLPIPTFP